MHLGEKLLVLFIEAGRTRLELLAVEFAAERRRVVEMLALGLVFGIALLLGLAFASFLIIAYLWDTHRLAAIAGVSLVYGLIVLATALRLRRLFREAPTAFANTRDTLQRDLTALRSRMHPAQPDNGTAVEPFSGDPR
ncbi:MAG TPA: phage holin family protein [Dongiaceae bacterium]|nr:phage holin family protein [Dongiaceae bacterium]